MNQIMPKITAHLPYGVSPFSKLHDKLHKHSDSHSILEELWKCLEELGYLGFGYFRLSKDLPPLEYGDGSGPTHQIRTSNNQYSLILKRLAAHDHLHRSVVDSETCPGSYIICPVFGPYYRNGLFIVHAAQDLKSCHEEDLRALDTILTKTHIASAYREATIKERNLSLSARETDVLLKITQGLSNKEIALYLGISTHTVNGYVRRILLKTGVKDRLSACLLGLSIPVIGNKILSEAIQSYTS